MVEKILFIVLGALAVIGALGVVTRKNIVHGLMLLAFTFITVGGIFLLSNAFFLAVIQVLVYAGAILVLFTFVVMFLNLREFRQLEQLHPIQRWAAFFFVPVTLAEFIYITVSADFTSAQGGFTPEAIAAAGGNVRVLGEQLFNATLLPFEVASLILLVAMVGAIVLAKKEESPSIMLREWTPDNEGVRELLEQEV